MTAETLKELAVLSMETKALEEELAEQNKKAAAEREILAEGGRNTKAMLALVDLSLVTYSEEKGLEGLDLEAVKEEAPYLFHEKEEKFRGTGLRRGERKQEKEKETDIGQAFRRGLRR